MSDVEDKLAAVERALKQQVVQCVSTGNTPHAASRPLFDDIHGIFADLCTCDLCKLLQQLLLAHQHQKRHLSTQRNEDAQTEESIATTLNALSVHYPLRFRRLRRSSHRNLHLLYRVAIQYLLVLLRGRSLSRVSSVR
jgi:hypothetical protein